MEDKQIIIVSLQREHIKWTIWTTIFYFSLMKFSASTGLQYNKNPLISQIQKKIY